MTDEHRNSAEQEKSKSSSDQEEKAGHEEKSNSDGKDEGKKSDPGREKDKGGQEDGEEKDREEEDSKPPWYRRPLLVGTLMLVVIVLVIAGVLFWLHSRHYEKTDDAFIDVISERVSPRVPGQVLHVLVDDNQDVTNGEALVELDPSDYQARLEQSLSAQSRAEAQRSQAEAQKASAEAQLEQARANVAVAVANAVNATNDLRRYEQLQQENSGAVSQQQMDKVVTVAKNASSQLVSAQKSETAAAARVGEADAQIRAAQAELKSSAAQIRQARLNLSYTRIDAQLNGRVATKTVAEGNYVQPGMPLMAVVPREVYVTANFKESQLRYMRTNQPVEIYVDAYPDMKLQGHVDSVQPASGQAFSTLPAENATGNWVKVVQRVPVKIVFDELPNDPQRRLGPGMSVEVKVKVR